MAANNKTAAMKSGIRLFGSTKVLVLAALLIAISIVGKSLRVDFFSVIRISAETLPILMAGIFFGPFIGAAVGAGADLIGCFVTGRSFLQLYIQEQAAPENCLRSRYRKTYRLTGYKHNRSLFPVPCNETAACLETFDQPYHGYHRDNHHLYAHEQQGFHGTA